MESEAAAGSNKGYLRTTVLFWCLCILLLCAKSIYVLAPLIVSLGTLPLLVFFCLPPLVLLFSFGFLFRGTAAAIYWTGLSLILSLLFFADVLYFRAFQHFPSIAVLFNPSPLDGLWESIAALIRPIDFLLFCDIPFLFLIARKDRARFCHVSKAKLFAFPLVLSVLILFFYGIVLDRQTIMANTKYTPCYLSPLGFHIYDAFQLATAEDSKLTPQEAAAIESWYEKNQQYLDTAPAYSDLEGILAGKNLIVIQFESLEEVLVNYRYQGTEITPSINALLPESLYFSNIVSQVGDGNSSDAELLFNSSLYPLRKGSAFLLRPNAIQPAFPALLKTLGYQTIAIHGDEREYWGRDVVYPKLGYEEFISQESFQNRSTSGMGSTDEALYQEMETLIGELKTPYFLYAITLTSHLPYELGSEVDFSGISGDGITAQYLRSIQYADACLGQFIDWLKGSGRLQNTAIIIYGDHEGIHKYFEDTGLPANHQKIPFIVYIPGMEGMEIKVPGGQVDLFPTLARLLGLEKSSYAVSVMGRNLLGEAGGSGITWEGTVSDGVVNPEQLIEGLRLSEKILVKKN